MFPATLQTSATPFVQAVLATKSDSTRPTAPKKTDHLCRSQVVSETAIDGLTGWVRGRGRHNPSGSPSGNLGVQRAAAAAGSMPVLRTMGAAAGAARKRIKCEATAVSAAPSATPAEKKTRC